MRTRKLRTWMHTLIQRHGLEPDQYTMAWMRQHLNARINRRGPRSYLHRNIRGRLPEDMLEFNHAVMLACYRAGHVGG